MPCTDLPVAAIPSLPSPLSLSLPSIQGLSFGPSSIGTGLPLCCQITIPNPLNNLTPEIPLPPLIQNIATIAALLQLVNVINAFLGSLPIDCPMNST